MESMVANRFPDRRFWRGKKVFLTGDTGFKGSWLSLWLTELGADVTGYALKPPTKPSMWTACGLHKKIRHINGDIRDAGRLSGAIHSAKPEIVFHLAAQALVLESYRTPVQTYSANVMGTVNLLDAALKTKTVRAVLAVTSDKCYENTGAKKTFTENDRMGGFDPYSSSKACAELAVSAYRRSFFAKTGKGLASARAGNVIGGGDWAENRLMPDIIRAALSSGKFVVRRPDSVRPWQHVLEPLNGYLLLAEKLYSDPEQYSSAWNFGPDRKDAKPVRYIAERMSLLINGLKFTVKPSGEHEAPFLSLSSAKARGLLGWTPVWKLDAALEATAEWVSAYGSGKDIAKFSLNQIEHFSGL